MSVAPERILNDGYRMPWTGFGTWSLTGPAGIRSIVSAIEQGYRMIDTARSYGNEREVGAAIRRAGVRREDLFVTTKLRGADHGLDGVARGIKTSLEALGIDYVDLYLIHWPLPRVDRYLESWESMIGLRDRGLVRSIGVSNFEPGHLDRIIGATGVVPSVNQIEVHPHWQQRELRDVHGQLGIATQSWSPLAASKQLVHNPVITGIARRYDVDAAQVVLRWHVQSGCTPIPRASRREAQATNLDLFGFELTPTDLDTIASLQSERLWGGDPRTYEEL